MFKVGDIVRCISQPYDRKLRDGWLYEITKIQSIGMEPAAWLTNIDTGEQIGHWYLRRFELHRPGKKPKRYAEREYIHALPTR